jgi:hypothetical protein
MMLGIDAELGKQLLSGVKGDGARPDERAEEAPGSSAAPCEVVMHSAAA